MYMRIGVALLCLAASPAMAGEMSPEQARRFVVGKTFAYSCFDGTRGAGKIQADGSVIGTVQVAGRGPTKYAVLPPNTLRVRGEKVCAAVKGVMFEPCFQLEQTGDRSFRGSISGFNFAYCDFSRGGRSRAGFMRTAEQHRPGSGALRSSLAQ